MRKLFILALLLPVVTFANTKLECYSAGKLIYSGFGNDLYYDAGVLFMKEVKTNQVVISNADCILKTDLIK